MTDGDSTMEGGQDSVVGKRLAGVVWEKRHKGVPSDLDMAVILGPSGVSKDFAPTLLEEAAGPQIPQRWLCLAGNGANTTDLRGLADLLTASRLHVKLLVLAIHPALLARSDDYLSDSTNFDTRAFFAEMEGGNFTTAKLELAAALAGFSEPVVPRADPNRAPLACDRRRGEAQVVHCTRDGSRRPLRPRPRSLGRKFTCGGHQLGPRCGMASAS